VVETARVVRTRTRTTTLLAISRNTIPVHRGDDTMHHGECRLATQLLHCSAVSWNVVGATFQAKLSTGRPYSKLKPICAYNRSTTALAWQPTPIKHRRASVGRYETSARLEHRNPKTNDATRRYSTSRSTIPSFTLMPCECNPDDATRKLTSPMKVDHCPTTR